MFKIHVNDGQNPMPEDDVFYIIGKEGIFLKKKLGVMESLAPVKNISILKSVATSATMHIPKIPGPIVAKIIEFFKAVYKEHRSESVILVFYNEITKKFKMVPPHQKVTASAIDYNRGLTIDGMTMIGTFHCHASMSAFHSGTDDDDEKHFDGLHITIGDADEEFVSISASIVANGYRVMVEPTDYMENLLLMSEVNQVENKPVRRVWKLVNGKLEEDKVASSKYVYSYRKYDKRYAVNVTDHQKIFNKKWLTMVEKGTYAYKGYPDAYGMYGAPPGWGENFDAYAWGAARGWNTKKKGVPGKRDKSIKTIESHQKPGILFPKDKAVDDDFNPCENCFFRDSKIDWVIQQITDEVDDDFDEDTMTDNFIPANRMERMLDRNADGSIAHSSFRKCHVCTNTFMVEEGDEVCPFCYELLENSIDVPYEAYKKHLDSLESDEQTEHLLQESNPPLEKIPEPNSSFVPIPEKDTMLKGMFKRVFGKGV